MKDVFKMEKVQATFRPFKPKKSITESHGPEAKIRRVTELEATIEIGFIEGAGEVNGSFADSLGAVCGSFIVEMINLVAGDEDRHGFDHVIRGQLPDMIVDVFVNIDDEEPLFCLPLSRCRKKSKLKVDAEGNAILVVRLLTRLEDTDYLALTRMIDSDCWINASQSQVTIAEAADGKVVARMRKAK